MAKRNSEPMGGRPDPNRWYTLSLGNSFDRQNPSSKFCTLRYEFKPASIDKRQPGFLHKIKDNRVTVEFQNNQHGKPKVTFEGTSGNYNENDAVLFFDGETFVLERLHRGVKRLRHVRLLDDSLAPPPPPPLPVASSAQTDSPPPPKRSNFPSSPHRPELQLIPDGAQGIDSGDRQGIGAIREDANVVDHSVSYPNMSLDSNKDDSEELVDIMNVDDDDDDNGSGSVEKGNISGRRFDTGIDINLSHLVDMDDEIADVDVRDEEAAEGHSAAEALRAQVRAEGKGEETSSSSTSSGSESNPSRSGSSRSSLSRSGSGSRRDSDSESDSDSGSNSSDSEDSDNVPVDSI